MAIPQSLIDRFPPLPTQLFDLARRDVDDSMLWEIAMADYGEGAEEAFKELRPIRVAGVIPVSMSFQLQEVLQLTRWCRPEQPNPPPFAPGPTGRRGHQIRLFACAVLLRAASERDSLFEDTGNDSTLANTLISADVLGDEFSEAVGSLLTSQFPKSDHPVLVAVALLTIASGLRLNRMTEPDLNRIALWVMAEDEASRSRSRKFSGAEPEPIAFGVQYGHWSPVAVELEARAMNIADPQTRENVQLCRLLLETDWSRWQ